MIALHPETETKNDDLSKPVPKALAIDKTSKPYSPDNTREKVNQINKMKT